MRHNWDITTHEDHDVCTICGLQRMYGVAFTKNLKGVSLTRTRVYLINGYWQKHKNIGAQCSGKPVDLYNIPERSRNEQRYLIGKINTI